MDKSKICPLYCTVVKRCAAVISAALVMARNRPLHSYATLSGSDGPCFYRCKSI
jgi:hypothetical protein